MEITTTEAHVQIGPGTASNVPDGALLRVSTNAAILVVPLSLCSKEAPLTTSDANMDYEQMPTHLYLWRNVTRRKTG